MRPSGRRRLNTASRRAPAPLDRVLVALKPWQRGLPLEARHAEQLARVVRADVMLMSAVFDSRLAGRGAAHDAARTRMLAMERAALEKLAHIFRQRGTAVTTRAVWQASVSQGILDTATEWRARLVVVGAHEHGGRGARLTDTDWQLMRLAPCPLLVVKNRQFGGYPTIVAAVDPRTGAGAIDEAVLAVAHVLSRSFGSTLRVLHALPDASSAEKSKDSRSLESRRRALDELVTRHDILASDAELAHGRPAKVILRRAEELGAGLVVIGALQRRRYERPVLGSTAEAVAMETRCDVLFVPPAPRPHAAGLTGRARTAKPRRPRASSAAAGRPPQQSR